MYGLRIFGVLALQAQPAQMQEEEMKINLTASQVLMILSFIQENEEEGWYFGDARLWQDRRNQLKNKLEDARKAKQ